MENAISCSLESSDVTPETFKEFDWAAKLCHQVFIKTAAEVGMPKLIEIILAEDFDKTVLERMRKNKEYENQFTSERPFGHVAAKNLAQDDLQEHVVIVFNASDWSREMSNTGNGKLLQLALIAHELAHPFLARMRQASGAAKGVVYPSITPSESAKSLSRIIVDEYHADFLADLIVNQLCTKNVNGGSSPAHVWDVLGQLSLESLKQYLSDAGTIFPGHVNSYRTRQIPLNLMWGKILNETAHLFTMYIHARALADVSGETILMLDAPEIKSLPFVRKYLMESTYVFLNKLREHRPLVSVEKWREMETDVIPAGELAFMDIWKRLGLTFREVTPQQPFHIIVTEPT